MGGRPKRADDQAFSPDPAMQREIRRARAELTFEDQSRLGALFGQYDGNLVQVENRLGVFIAARGNQVQIEGPPGNVARARDVLQTMYDRIEQGHDLDAGAVESLIAMSSEPTLEGIIKGDLDEAPVMIRTRRKTIVPRSAGQIPYMRQLAREDIIFALGPAGTGKTYLAVAQAVSQLMSGSVQRLILSRPAVEAGERLGFLPGDMKEKVDPYLRPLYDALYDCMPPEQVERRGAAGIGRDRDCADRLHARAHAGRQLHHPRRGAEHHARTDEDVPHPLWPEQPDGGVRRSQTGRYLGRRPDERARRCGRAAGGGRGNRGFALHQRRCGAPPDSGPDRQCL